LQRKEDKSLPGLETTPICFNKDIVMRIERKLVSVGAAPFCQLAVCSTKTKLGMLHGLLAAVFKHSRNL
jgi:hypothetical protein